MYDLGLEASLKDENGRTIPVTTKKGILTVRPVGGRIVSVLDVSVNPGQSGVIVSLEVDDAKGIAGGNFTLSYPAEALAAKQEKGTELLAGFLVTPNVQTPGQVRVSMAGATGIVTGKGALVTVVFDVKVGAAAGNYDLVLEASLKDENGRAIPVTARKGALTVTKDCKADFNCDGEVNFDDFFLFANAFGQKATGENARFDLSRNGEVDFDDFSIFAETFGQKT